MAERERERVTLAYAGRRLNSKQRIAYCYAFPGKPDDGDLMVFAKPLWPALKIGTEISVVMEDGTSVLVDGREVLGQTEDDAAILAWSAHDRAAEVLHARLVLSKAHAKAAVDPLQESLDVIREAYNGIGRGHYGKRAAFIEYVNAYIQGER